MAVSEDGEQAVAVTVQGQVTPHSGHHVLKTRGLKDEATYHFYNIPVKHDLHRFGELINMIAPIHIKQDSMVQHLVSQFVKMDGEIEDYEVYGDALMYGGVLLKQGFSGTGYNEEVRHFPDFGSRIYFMEAVED